jgi:hypothetical protein
MLVAAAVAATAVVGRVTGMPPPGTTVRTISISTAARSSRAKRWTVEVEVTDAAGGETHRMCTQFTVERVRNASARCRIVSRAGAPAPCGVCGVAPPTTTVTITTTTSTSTTVVPCGFSFPACDGACPEGNVCLPVSVPDGEGCLCVSLTFTCVGSAPMCNGTCPEGTTCQPFVPGLCECQ